jgi:hypothetical protein
MEFLFGEDSPCENICTLNVNSRWIKPSAIHDNA